MKRNWRSLVELLAGRPHRIGAEVGVFEGECALGLLRGLPHLERLICVDLWERNEDFAKASPNKGGKIFNADWNNVLSIFTATVLRQYGRRVSPMRMSSLEAAGMLKDESLDFAFIDANHSYEYVLADIKAWSPKVKMGGLIAGDDYVNKPTYGVIQAVNECFDSFEVDKRSRVWHTIKGGTN